MTTLDEIKEDLHDVQYMTIITGLQAAYDDDEGDLHILTYLYIVPRKTFWRFVEGGPDECLVVRLEDEVRTIMCPLTESDLRAMKPNGVINHCPVNNLIGMKGVLLPSMTRKRFGDDDDIEIEPKCSFDRGEVLIYVFSLSMMKKQPLGERYIILNSLVHEKDLLF
jgi:hypothetical protein